MAHHRTEIDLKKSITTIKNFIFLIAEIKIIKL